MARKFLYFLVVCVLLVLAAEVAGGMDEEHRKRRDTGLRRRCARRLPAGRVLGHSRPGEPHLRVDVGIAGELRLGDEVLLGHERQPGERAREHPQRKQHREH